jgi:hypothetical protein
MGIKDKQGVVIEFLRLGGGAGEEIVISLRIVYGSAAYCRASAFRWISKVRGGNEKLRNEGPLERPADMKLIR